METLSLPTEFGRLNNTHGIRQHLQMLNKRFMELYNSFNSSTSVLFSILYLKPLIVLHP